MTSMDNPKFSFSFVSLNETSDRVNKLNPKKASRATVYQSKLLRKQRPSIILNFSYFRQCIINDILK